MQLPQQTSIAAAIKAMAITTMASLSLLSHGLTITIGLASGAASAAAQSQWVQIAHCTHNDAKLSGRPNRLDKSLDEIFNLAKQVAGSAF